MDVRLAEDEDLAVCANIPPTVQSTHVWQLRLGFDPTAALPGEELGASLYRTRLPRAVAVRPASAETLEELWQRASDVVLAEDGQGIAGYAVLTVAPAALRVSVARLVVAPTARRRGAGSLLMRAALQWGRAMQLDGLATHCPARNDPAVAFFMRCGLRFAGYSEALYPRGEIALFWHRPL